MTQSSAADGNVFVIKHPLVQHKLTIMRKKETSTSKFRRLAGEIAMLLAYEVTRDMPMTLADIETPIMKMKAPILKGQEIVLVSILRAGNGILDGMLKLIPSAHIGHIGLYREPKTQVAVEYYFKMPPNMPERDVIIVDPMLATGHSAVAAIDRVKEQKPKSIKYVCLLAAPEGVAFVQEHHPDVPIYTAAIDQGLNDKAYIVPGLGDAGDRMFGTL
ncbi:MAG: uracil phosphoribosyltransferase [Deltaproteobacteria bacterium]|nr:uracil phosphoribosyltransferase [Deltaproteobacteria bacterium]